MSGQTGDTTTRAPLSRQRVLRAAVALADAQGIGALTMRRLGQALGVEAMSLYKHVANKDAILDGIVDAVIQEIDLPEPGADWRTGMRQRARSAREVYARHPWALTLLQSRVNPGPAALRYYDGVLGSLRRGGFSVAMAAHAFTVLDSYIIGFAVQEQSLPFDVGEGGATDVTEAILQEMPVEDLPHLTEMAVEHVLKPGYSFAGQFEFGLDLILDALGQLREEP